MVRIYKEKRGEMEAGKKRGPHNSATLNPCKSCALPKLRSPSILGRRVFIGKYYLTAP